MSVMGRLRVLTVCTVLQVGVLSGVPMVPDHIREFLNQMNQPKVAHALPSDEDSGDDAPNASA